MKKFKIWLNIKHRNFWTRYYKYKYRHEDRDVCCCGGYVSKCNPWDCGATGVSQVDRSIYLAVEHHMGDK